MKEIDTKYGVLSDISFAEFYANGNLRGVIVSSPQTLNSEYGRLIPQYENDGVRRKFIDSVTFYENGNLKSVSLQHQIEIATSLGPIPVEKIIFYENGKLKRIFPLNGKITGFWSEANEYALAEPITFNFPFGGFKCKVIGIFFYETGTVKSITLWPQETVDLQTEAGIIPVRGGFSLYSDGKLASVELLKPTRVVTPIGGINAYNVNAIGVVADRNSLSFTAEGQVNGIVTSTDRITVVDAEGRSQIFQPQTKPSLLFEGKLDILPLQIDFAENKVCFGTDKGRLAEFQLDRITVSIENLPLKISSACAECAACGSCD